MTSNGGSSEVSGSGMVSSPFGLNDIASSATDYLMKCIFFFCVRTDQFNGRKQNGAAAFISARSVHMCIGVALPALNVLQYICTIS